MTPLSIMVKEAIGFIRQHDPRDEPYFVAFSGGKDSIVTLQLVRMANVKHEVYYQATGIDPPELSKFIKRHYPEVVWLKPKMNFYEGVKTEFPPTRWGRWCCNELKKKTAMQIPLNHHVLGLRAEESFQRKSRPRVDYHTKLKKWNYKPIFDWLTWHVWEFIESNNLPYPSLYDEGFDRIGCVICPFICYKNSKKLALHKARWPKQYSAFERAVHWYWENTRDHSKIVTYSLMKSADGNSPIFSSAEEFLTAWYRGFE
jgi:phosphoadenosine phosphosulfate reductase